MKPNQFLKTVSKHTTFLLTISLFLNMGCSSSQKENSDQTQTVIHDTVYINDNYKVTGVGGIFFKSNNPEISRDWYAKNLGFVTNEYGTLFEYREGRNPDHKAYLQWSPFHNKTTYFDPSKHDFMINFRVGDLERLLNELRANDVTILDTIETYEYGKFVHILDPDSVKVELWQPADSSFTALYEGKTTK